MTGFEPQLAISPGLVALGLTVVGSILGAIFRKGPDDQVTEGPRLTGTRELTVSTWGISKPIGFGVVPQLTVNVDFADEIEEEVIVDKETFSSGGFFGLFEKDYDVIHRTFLYYQNWAASVAEVEFPNSAAANGRPARLLEVWINNEKWFDATAEGDGFLRPGFEFVWFDGAQDQQPWEVEDTVVSAREGTDNSAPAYRGTCRIAFPRFKLDDTGRQIPQQLLLTVDFTGGTPKLPTTIYTSSNLPDQMRVDPVRRIVYAYDDTNTLHKIDLTSNQLTNSFDKTNYVQINGGEAISIDLQGTIYMGATQPAPDSHVTAIDPITGEAGVIALATQPFRISAPGDALQFGDIGALLLTVSGSTGNVRVRVFTRKVRDPDDGAGIGYLQPIWGSGGDPMDFTPIASDAWSASWRRSPGHPDAASTVEWWVTSDSVFGSPSDTIITRVRVVGGVAPDPLGLQQALNLVGFEAGVPVHWGWVVEDTNLTEQIPETSGDQLHLCYVAEDDTYLVVASGVLLKLQPPPFGRSETSMQWTLLGQLTASDLGFPGPNFIAPSISSLISYPGTGLLAIVGRDSENDVFALVDPVAFELAKKPGLNQDAVYTRDELGLTGQNMAHIVYDAASHSIVVRNQNTDLRRIFLDRADGNTADLADVHHALSTRGVEDWDVAGPGLRSSWNGSAHTDADDQIDVTAINGNVVRGYSVRDASTGKGAIEQLQKFYPTATGYYTVESDFVAKSVPLGSAPVFALTVNDLVVEDENPEPIGEISLADREFPRRVIVTTQGTEVGGERISAPEKRNYAPIGAILSNKDKREEFSVYADPSERKTVARRLMARAHAEERAIEWTQSPRFLAVDAGDSGTITIDGVTHTVRVGTPEIGNDFKVQCKGVTDDREAYLLPAGTGAVVGGFNPPALIRPVVTDFALVDVPVPGGVASPGLYLVPLVTVSTWAGASFQRSIDGATWESFAALDTIPTWGRASKLADGGPGLDLVNTVDITVPSGINTAPAGSGFARISHSLTNDGFETGDLTGWTEVLSAGYTNWQAQTSAAGVTAADEGTYFVGANVDPQDNAELYQDVDAVTAGVATADFDAGLVEVVVGWLQNSTSGGDDPGGVRIDFYDGDPSSGGNLIQSRTSSMESSDDGTWLPREFRVAAPVGTRWYRLALVNDGTRVGGVVSVFFDAITLESLEVGSLFQFSTISELEAGRGRIVIGREVLAYGDWEYLGSDVYRLSTLLRGLECTEHTTGSHIANELAFLPETVARGSLTVSDVGTVALYRAISSQTGTASPGQSYTYQGLDLVACAPAGLEAYRAPWHGDVLVRWDFSRVTGSDYEIELIHATTGSVVRTYSVGRSPIEQPASRSDFEHMTFTPISHVQGATGNGDFETGDITGWKGTHRPSSLDVDTSAPRQSVGNHLPYEGTYLLRLDGTTTDAYAGIERSQLIDLILDGVSRYNIDNGFAMLTVKWRQAGFDQFRDRLYCEIEWYDTDVTFLTATAKLNETIIISGFVAGTVSTSNFGTTTIGKRCILETAADAEARGTWMQVNTAPSGGDLTVGIERNGSSTGATWTVPNGSTGATLANATLDEWDANDTINLDGGTINGAADILYQIALRNLEVFEYDADGPFTIPQGVPGATATATTGPSGGDTTFWIRKNDTVVGSFVFADGETSATFTFASNALFTASDRLTVTAPFPSNLNGIDGVSFSLPIVSASEAPTKVERSPSKSVPADTWTLRTFSSRAPAGARFAQVRLIGVEVDTSDPTPSVNTYLDDIEITTEDAGIWRVQREAGQPADFTTFIPDQLVYQEDPAQPNTGFFELVKVVTNIDMHFFVPSGAGTVNDTSGSDSEDWTQYGEQVRIPLADIEAAGYTRGDSITVKVYEVRLGRRGQPLTGTV